TLPPSLRSSQVMEEHRQKQWNETDQLETGRRDKAGRLGGGGGTGELACINPRLPPDAAQEVSGVPGHLSANGQNRPPKDQASELEFHLSGTYDYIKIYNGVSEDEGNLLGDFCGDSLPPPFTSSWNTMSIIFHSDRHVAHRGFNLGYRKDMCGGVLTGLSGLISSPVYPREYSNNADCSWTIHASNGSTVSLVFMDFQLENNEGCNFDFEGAYLGKYCGGDSPPDTVTTSNQLLVVFKSDFNVGGQGFKAYYYSGECQQVLSAGSGNFSSPHFPGMYPNNVNCHWTVILAAGYRIKLFFPLVELEDRNSLTDDYDSVAVYDGDSNPCWATGVAPSGNKLLVVLSTDRNQARRGFSATYVGGEVFSKKRQNITMLVITLYINFSDKKQCHRQEYEVQCDAQWKTATVALISTEECDQLNQRACQVESAVKGGEAMAAVEPHDPSHIVFISICVLAVILMCPRGSSGLHGLVGLQQREAMEGEALDRAQVLE
ncbi:hypothetical protein NHX12_003781, partial [Muraenolepis orangiensis]